MPAFTPPPPAPQRGDRATFSQRVDAFLSWIVVFIGQINTFFASLTSLAAGGAASFGYSYDPTTTDNDPGPGSMRFSSATQAASQAIRIDNVTDDGVDITAYLTALGTNNSTIKGSVRVQKVNDPTKWLLFDITAVNNLGGYRNLTVQPRAASAQSPFIAGDPLQVFFDRKGDKGEGGNTPTPEEMRAAIGTLPVENGGTGSTNADGARANLGLGNVNNTSDANKPVSSAQAQADNQRVAKSGDRMAGPLDFPNGVPIRMMDTAGNLRQAIGVGANNDVQLVNIGGNNWQLYDQAVTRVIFNIDNSGNVSATRMTGMSDESLKENWRGVPDSFLEDFAAIERAGLFDWREDGSTDGGVGAQSIKKVAPWCVFKGPDGVLRVNYAALNFVVVHALARRVLRNGAAR